MSDSEDSPLQALKATHSKEKKELQAKITALKKSVPNTDKKKKKEITSEIEKLEKDLKDKHAKELEELELKFDGLKINEAGDAKHDTQSNGEVEEKVSKVSKKQKRLDKKAADSKRWDEAEAEDEAAAATSRATHESESIKEALEKRNLKLYDIAPDGDCLYNAIAHQLSSHSKRILSGANLRAMAADYMKKNPDEFSPFLTDADGEMLNDKKYKEYIEKVEAPSAQGGEWGGDAEIRAISCSCSKRIEVIQPNGQVIVFGEDLKSNDPIVLTYHRHAYALGEHYNSTVSAAAN
jgi:OTU domain-containing protein 6